MTNLAVNLNNKMSGTFKLLQNNINHQHLFIKASLFDYLFQTNNEAHVYN